MGLGPLDRENGSRDPFAGLAALAALPPRDAVLAAYARLLLALDNAGHSRPERATPYEHLSALPARLRPVSKPAQALTELYVLAAYGDEELSGWTGSGPWRHCGLSTLE
jgi:hypothetical protein